MTFSDEQRAFAEAIRDFGKRECGTRQQRDALTNDGETPHSPELYGRMAELGWLGVAIPEEYGGSGGGCVELCVFLEEWARAQVPIQFFVVTMIVAGAYERLGNEEQKQEVLRGIASGSVEAIAMSEPGAGSDVGALTCRARREGDLFVLDGQKTWITAAHEARHLLVVCRTEAGSSKHQGLSMISVPTDAQGIEIRPIETLGGSEVNEVFLTECRVPAERVLGGVGEAWAGLMAGLNRERLIVAAQHLGIAQRAFDDVLAYVKEREQFGQPIGRFQAIKHRIADLATELEVCRLLVYDVASRVDADPERTYAREASMAKLKVTEVAKRIALDGLQMMGGYGYSCEYDMERYVRSTLVGTIYGGTSEIQREIISRSYGL